MGLPNNDGATADPAQWRDSKRYLWPLPVLLGFFSILFWYFSYGFGYK